MKIFDINQNIKIICDTKNTRNGFKHIATLFINNNDILETKICYLNRTWESFEYESVINKLKELAIKENIFNFKLLNTEQKI